jgi:hypothetical protein
MTKHETFKRLFGWLAIIGPLHMVEQLIFGIEELAEVRQVLGVYYSWFASTDYATVLLVTIAGATGLVAIYGAIADGRWLTAVAALFGLLCIGELHHVAKAIMHGAYNPGTVTAVPFVAIGLLLVQAAFIRPRVDRAAESFARAT